MNLKLAFSTSLINFFNVKERAGDCLHRNKKSLRKYGYMPVLMCFHINK